MKRGSAKQKAEDRHRTVATKRSIFLNANGWRLMRTIESMVFISTECAKAAKATRP